MPEHSQEIKPYGSALDLPSFAKMLEQVRGLKLITRIVSRKQRPQVIKLEQNLTEMAATVDGFYQLLGPRNWIFHEQLSMTFAESLLASSPDEAEHALVELYRDPEKLHFMVRRLGHYPEFRVRAPLIERAEADFHAGRYYASVQILLSVMDGFVNDVERASRRGLHARDAEEMIAWDSVVGHHMGLTHAHQTFTKPFKKTSTDEVHELYRNGIVHGMLINYDNEVVAAKAWNRIFAVADWAASRQKQAADPKPAPSWRELAQRIDENRRTRSALDAWRPSSISAADPSFEDDEVIALSRQYLEAWQTRNFGHMAVLLSPLVAEDTHAKTAGEVRATLGTVPLTGYELDRVDHDAAAVAEVHVALELDGEKRTGAMRWIRGDATGQVAAPNQSGSWRLITWTHWAITTGHRPERRGGSQADAGEQTAKRSGPEP